MPTSPARSSTAIAICARRWSGPARGDRGRVAVGAVCKAYLAQFGITVGGYVTSIGDVEAALPDDLRYPERFALAEESDVRCPDAAVAEAMRKLIWDVMQANDTLGGVFEIVALGVPPGLGSHVHFDRRLDGRLLAALGSIQAIKGVEIGPAFANARLRGTQVHDEIMRDDAGICAAPAIAPAVWRAASPPASRLSCARR